MKKTLTFFILIISLASYSYAYTQSNLIAYYDFNTFYGNYMIHDVRQSLLNTSSYDLYNINKSYNYVGGSSITGIKGNGYSGNLVTLNNYIDFSNLPHFAINFWYKRLTNQLDRPFNFQDFNTTSSYSVNTTALLLTEDYAGGTNYLLNSPDTKYQSISAYNNTWHMLTMNYNASGDNKIDLYIDGALISNFNYGGGSFAFSISSRNSNKIDVPYNYIDEYSIFNTWLDGNTIQQLYNGGTGLSFQETFDNGLDFNTSIFYDICILSNNVPTLCHTLIKNNNSYTCAVTQQVFCPAYCTDTSDSYILGYTFPPNNNYSGACSYTLPPEYCNANNLNIKKCNPDNSISQCQYQYGNLYLWKPYSKCNYPEICSNGNCIFDNSHINDTNVSGEVGQTMPSDIQVWNGFFGMNATTPNNRFMIAFVTIILSCIIGTILVSFVAKKSTSKVNGAVSTGLFAIIPTLMFLYFCAIGFIPFWVLVILMIILAFAIGGYLTGKVFRR